MLFFTDITTNASNYCLCNIKNYNDPRLEKKSMVFIDPGVYELKKSNEYSNIELLHLIAEEDQDYISIDYPCDMNQELMDEFIEKSIKNNLKYKDKLHYIATVQFKFQDFNSFKKEFEYLEQSIDFRKKIVGIGNMCRIMRPNDFTNQVFKMLYEKPYWFHVYGLSLALIKKYMGVFSNSSVDSTKWTRACTAEFKKNHQVCCRKENRDEYFLEYMRNIKKYIPFLQW